MGITQRLLDLFAPREERAMSLAQFMDNDILPDSRVSQDSATRLSVVMACQRLIADSISTLPVAPYIRVGGERKVAWNLTGPWLDAPHGIRDPNYVWSSYVSELVTSILSDGNSFTYAMPFADENASELHVLNPQRVRIELTGDSTKLYHIDIDGKQVTATSDNIIHIPRPPIRPGTLRGVSPIDEARTAISAAADAERYAAAWFRNGGVPSGWLEYPGDRTQAQADELLAKWNKRHAGAEKVGTALLTGGVKYNPIPFTFEQAQFIQSRQFSIEDLARLFGVPLHMLNVATPGAMSYASVEQNSINYVQYTILPLVSRIEQAHDRLLPGPATALRFDMKGLLRGDTASRAAYYRAMFEVGSMSPNDIRGLEDMPPVPSGDLYRVPLNLGDANEKSQKGMLDLAQSAAQLSTAGFVLDDVAAILGLPAPTAEKPEPPAPPAPNAMSPGTAMPDMPPKPGGPTNE